MKKVEIAKKNGVKAEFMLPTDFSDLVKNFTEESVYKFWMTCITWKLQGIMGEKDATAADHWLDGLRKPDPVAQLMKNFMSMGMSESDAEAMTLAALEKIAKK